jgi:hypothetical protein
MAIYRPAGSRVWRIDFLFHSQRINETTGMTSRTRARDVEDKRKQDLKDGVAGIRRPPVPRLVSVAAEEWLEMKRPKWSPEYQKTRIAEGASGRTANLEVGVLRQIMCKHGLCARIQNDVHMLAERQDVGRALNTEEESALLAECSCSRSRALYTFVLLTLETGAPGATPYELCMVQC